MFRQEAINNKKNKWRGQAILLPGIPYWIIAGLCLFFISAFLTFVITGTYTRRINVTGEISSSPRAAIIYSANQGIVVKQFVTEGQKIKVGDSIYQIDVSKSTRNGVVSDNQRKNIDNQLERIKQIINRLQSNKAVTISMLEKQKMNYMNSLRRSTDILRRAQKGISFMKENMDNYQRYQAQGLINKDQLNNQVSLYYQQQNNLLTLSNLNEQNALQVTALDSQIHTEAADFDNKIYEMELQLYELEKELFNTDAGGTIIVRSMIDGQIDSLGVSIGQMVNIGDSLLQIIPRNINHYFLVLWVPNDAIPYISVGDQVNIRYDAFPAEKFGQFAGTVSIISRVPASPQEMFTYRGAPNTTSITPNPYYKIIVKLEKQAILYSGKYLSLENGMKAQSTLFLEKRNIYQWMVSPFYDLKHSVIGPIYE